MTRSADVLIIGAGHNGLVAAAFLAREGLTVTVLEEKSVIGGAVRTEYPFARAPRLGVSSGAYLLGVMQPELIQKLGANFFTLRINPPGYTRAPHRSIRAAARRNASRFGRRAGRTAESVWLVCA